MTKLAKIEVHVNAVAADAELVFVFQDSAKKAIAGKGPHAAILEKYRKGEVFSAKSGQIQVLPFAGTSGMTLVLVGVGAASELTEEKLRVAGAHAMNRVNAEKVATLAVHVDGLGAKGFDASLRAFAEGLLMTAYKFDKYKTSPDAKKDVVGPGRILFVTSQKAAKKRVEEIVQDVAVAVECVNVTRDWSNEPSNTGIPEFYAKEASRLAKENGIKCTILDEAAAAKEKMSLYLAVGQGSEREARIVVLDYNPKGAKKTVALVGKGVTFDSGGISIKPSMRMEDMKHDMTGAATMMGATLLAAKRKVKNRVITILAFTENMPSGSAINPGSVVNTRAGKTVEIINTDAEGRLILADVLDYAQDFNPDCVVNAATLTGAVVVALGKQCCGLMGNDAKLMNTLQAMGDEGHERMWHLPLFDEYFDDLKTDCADMKNSANDGTGGTIRGGMFLKQFIRKGTKWAHMDIAATAYGMGHIPYYPKKGGSGMHVRTLARFLAEYK